MRYRSSFITTLATASLWLTAAVASAQYNAQILLPPGEFSQGLNTHAYVMNESGQVFGEVRVSNTDPRPVLWTNGVGTTLPVPNGYYWENAPGTQFLNNSGVVVARLRVANGVPGQSEDESRVGVWQNGVPQVLPPPDSCVWSGHQVHDSLGPQQPGAHPVHHVRR